MKDHGIILLCGNAPNQRALANKIAKAYSLKGIVIETNLSKKKIKFKQYVHKIASRLFLNKLNSAWNFMMGKYRQEYPEWPSCEILNTNNINSKEVLDFCKNSNADLYMVSGTRIIKKELLTLSPKLGIINLHTGLSPYVKGGPNCTNWCLSTSDFHLIGNTVMWLDEGIDTGNLIKTDFVSFTGDEDLNGIHWKVIEHAHTIYLQTVGLIIDHKKNKPGIVQSTIEEGKTYYNNMWNFKEQFKAIQNLKTFRKFVKSGEMEKKRETISIVE